MEPTTAMALYGGGAALGALGSYLGGKSQADALEEANKRNEALTRESWQRDDTAVYRRTQDLINSGLNPALAAGSAASTSSPLPMQAAANSGPAAALQAAGQTMSGAPTVEQALKRSAAQTLQAEASANLTYQQAQIAEMDKEAIAAGQDPRDKTPINQLIKLIPRLAKNLSPGGALYDVAEKGAGVVNKYRYGDASVRAEADKLSSEAIRIMKNNPSPREVKRAKELNNRAEKMMQGGFRK